MLRIKVEAPKSPVNKGSKGSFRPRFKTLIPKKPERRKTKREIDFLFSMEMRRMETRINKEGRTYCLVNRP